VFDRLSDKITNAFRHLSGNVRITEENVEETLKEVKAALLEADVNFNVVKSFIEKTKTKAIGFKVLKGVNPGEQFVKIVHDELVSLMGDAHQEIDLKRPPVFPILLVGLNGAGKTTFAGKLANYLLKKKKDVLLVPADTNRPAAKEQLQALAGQLQVECFDSDLSMHPRDIVTKAMEAAAVRRKDIIIIDTAGRLHVDTELMEEIREVRDAIIAEEPEILLVVDAMTGQDAVNVSKSFHDQVGLTGVVLSKMDSDARGGAALSIRHVAQVPIRFLSVGEKLGDLDLFYPDRLAKRILDMGDVLSLVEKAQEVVSEDEIGDIMGKMASKEFTLEDFLQQMKIMNRFGSVENLFKLIPGMGGLFRKLGDVSHAQGELEKIKTIISSMTVQERQNYKLIKGTRKERIARGSGTSVAAVNSLLEKFVQVQQVMAPMLGLVRNKGILGFNQKGSLNMKGQRMAPQYTPTGKSRNKLKHLGPFGKKYF
jgi:signal recognition particle subunit SRP54